MIDISTALEGQSIARVSRNRGVAEQSFNQSRKHRSNLLLREKCKDAIAEKHGRTEDGEEKSCLKPLDTYEPEKNDKWSGDTKTLACYACYVEAAL